ncbi:MAG: TlpA family protein disulfide reductase [Phycisphaerae bacterium]|nr:TlpA family protein disulfide reductase [Phycisphaerae bacterium]
MLLPLLAAPFLIALAQDAPASAPAAAPAASAPTATTAPAERLSLGSKAPAPDISDFIRGARPEFFEPGKVYVLEFWATWCPPCRASMPHLSDLADKYKDKGVVVVGVSDEAPAKVESFLNKDEWKQKARYILAADPDHSTHTAYMKASGQQGIPTAFVVKDGVVQWIGHPTELDKPLEQIVAGTWDLKSAKTDFDTAMEAERKAMAKQETIAKAFDAKDWPTVLKAMDELIDDATGPDKAMMQLNKAQVLLIADRNADGYALIETVLKGGTDGQLHTMAATIVLRTPELKDRRVDSAIAWLETALKAEDSINAQALAELASAWNMKGDHAKAVEFTERAISAAQSWGPAAADYVVELKERLREYKAAAAQAK